jgi:rare lipoprotein A
MMATESFLLPSPIAIALAPRVRALPVSAEGVASYYSYECADQPMANGKPFDPEKRTCASWFYKFGTVLAVKSLDTGLSTEVVVTDRGPNKRLVKQGRIIDLSKRAFEDISPLEKGLTKVRVTVKS